MIMWPVYVALFLIAILIVVVIVLRRQQPIVEPAPEQKYLVVRIDNTLENSSKVYNLEENQVVVIFRKDSLIDISRLREFTISTYASSKGISIKDLDFKMLHFYIFNIAPVTNLSIKIEEPLRMIDAEYGTPIGIKPKGNLSLEHKDIEQLFKHLFLFRKAYGFNTFFDDLRVYIFRIVTNVIIQFSIENKVSLLMLHYYIDDLEEVVVNELNNQFSQFGLMLTRFEFSEFQVLSSNELTKLDKIIMQKLKYEFQNYTFADEKKKKLMDKVNFKVKAEMNKSTLINEVKNL